IRSQDHVRLVAAGQALDGRAVDPDALGESDLQVRRGDRDGLQGAGDVAEPEPDEAHIAVVDLADDIIVEVFHAPSVPHRTRRPTSADQNAGPVMYHSPSSPSTSGSGNGCPSRRMVTEPSPLSSASIIETSRPANSSPSTWGMTSSSKAASLTVSPSPVFPVSGLRRYEHAYSASRSSSAPMKSSQRCCAAPRPCSNSSSPSPSPSEASESPAVSP